MKQLGRVIVGGGIASFFFWLLAWFVFLEPNPFNWSEIGRFFLAVLFVIFGVVIAGIWEANDEELEDWY